MADNAPQMKVQVHLSTGMVGCDRSDVLEMDAGLSDEDIAAEVRDWAWNYLELSWDKVDEEDGKDG